MTNRLRPIHKERRLPASQLTLITLLLIALACNLESQLTPTTIPTANSESAPTPTLQIPPTATQTAVDPDSGWTLLQPGLERRTINLQTAENEQRESLYILRVDPAHFRFDVGYHPGQPQSLEQWQTETGALIVINGGFFTEENIATGAIVVDGQASGTSYQDFGGMLSITADGPALRWLPQQPYNSAETIVAGLQSFPMLVTPGGQLGYPDEDGDRARRTVIAQDTQSRILFILAINGSFTLHQMSRFLVQSDMNIDRALNLDGGTSTGLRLSEPAEGIAAFSLLPTVILVYPKN